MTARAVREPELPEAARPQWPPWYAPVALFAGFGAVLVASFPLLPVILTVGISDTLAGIALLALLLVQDGLFVLAAVIAIHAAFNTVAMLSVVPLPAILIGLLVIAGCLLAPLRAGPWPSPLPA